jgi:predicted amidophosphoribosyltransferase
MADDQTTLCPVCGKPVKYHFMPCEEKPRDAEPEQKPAGCYTNIISRSNVQALM